MQMRLINGCVIRTLLALVGTVPILAQQHELGLTLGGLLSQDRGATPAQALTLGSGIALQANYAYRLLRTRKAALYGEVHFLANPLRNVSSVNRGLTRDVATLYVTPGIRVKLFPRGRVSPYLAVGGGYALYEQSTDLLGGGPNPAPRFLNRGAFDFGGGADVHFWRFLALRAEVRDFYTGSPAYNTRSITAGQHNVVAGGGIVLRFH